jgi:hypothetical protein
VDRPESFPELVGVLDTNDNFALGMAAAALSEAGIVYDIVAIADLPENLEAEKPKWWIRPTRILVAAEDASEARSLVEPFQTPRSKSDIEASSARELVDAVKPSLIWKGPPDAPFVERVGARLIGSLFVCFGLLILYETLKESPLVGVLFCAALVFVGVEVFLNGIAGNSK